MSDTTLELAQWAQRRAGILRMTNSSKDRNKFDDIADALRQAASTREACAALCDNLPAPPSCNPVERSLWDVATTACADAIRALGERT